MKGGNDKAPPLEHVRTRTHTLDESPPAGQAEAEKRQQKQGVHTHARCQQQMLWGRVQRAGRKALGRPCGDVCVSASTPTHITHTYKGEKGEGGGEMSRGEASNYR